MNTTKRALSQRRHRAGTRMMVIFLAVLTVCLALQITLLVKTTRQNHAIRVVQKEITQLDAQARNMKLLLGQLGDRERVRALAADLGMVEATGDHLRVVSLPDAQDTLTLQSAENVTQSETLQ